ncbi:MAG: DUF4446 family protein [Armatimonadetes bacterium]|nr:DUF4446 family protein [Armatimonadota bacterium]CUU37288.1 Protein of unknown function (DUF4446) [Armatimonadetes bacterium DC]
MIETLQPNEWVMVLLGITGVLALWNLWLTWRWLKFQKRWRQLLTHSEGGSLEHALYETLRRVTQLEEILKAHGNHLQALQSQTDRCLQQVGVLRYDAFPDMGGQQSFAIALVDKHGDGVVLSGIHSRQEMRVYAKPIRGYTSSIGLSEEEQTALREARAR